jgi:hypothetical protein
VGKCQRVDWGGSQLSPDGVQLMQLAEGRDTPQFDDPIKAPGREFPAVVGELDGGPN